MADKEVVIKIDEEDYKTLINMNDSNLPSIIARRNLYEALRDSTPLPKVYGKLIDADVLINHITNLPKCPNGHSQVYDEAMIIDIINKESPILTFNATLEQ